MKTAEKLNSDRVFHGKVFNVDRDRVRMRNGREVTVDIVRHSKSVVLVPMTDPGHVTLVKQFRYAVNADLWELPAGGVDDGERPEAAAARECEEEIGRVPQRVQRLGAFFPTPGYCDEEMIFFRVSELKAPPPDSTHRPDEDEEIESKAVTMAEAKAMVARGDIVDLKTAYALTLI